MMRGEVMLHAGKLEDVMCLLVWILSICSFVLYVLMLVGMFLNFPTLSE